MEDIRSVLQLSHTLWGGRYNPLIPIGDTAVAMRLVEAFRVDALYPASRNQDFNTFAKSFPYLPPPDYFPDVFIEGSKGKLPTFLDIYHPVRHLSEEYVKKLPSPKISATIFEWNATDPLATVFLANFGSYPSPEESGRDYMKFVQTHLSGERVTLSADHPINPDTYKLVTPSKITGYRLLRDRLPRSDDPGIYVGSAIDFTDIVNFWNLRASDVDLFFYDPAHAHCLRSLKDAYLAALREKLPPEPEWPDVIAIWSKSHEDELDLSEFGPGTVRRSASPIICTNIRPPLMHFGEKSIMGSVSDDDSTPTVSFQLTEKPFFDNAKFHTQHVVASVHPLVDITKSEQWTWQTPYIPPLNEYYGRECHFIWNECRAETDGLGIITEVTRDHLTLRALFRQSLVAKIFEVFGIKAEPSQPGLVSTRLIQQMGGVQGCRVFKIRGVRTLIEKYSPFQSFTRSAAIQTIGQNDPVTGKPNFEAYERLFIEQSPYQKLKPEDAFTYLVKNGVFRVGLRFNCPNCNLDFWLPLDNVATEVVCEYCGTKFNVTPQLRDRDWGYRRSGLFGREDHQQGSIPVVLTLQQLDTTIGMHSMIYVTGFTLKPNTVPINQCEIDFVALKPDYEKRVQLVIGECKTGHEITEQDVENLRKVADVFPSEWFNVFIVFSKTTDFTSDEIARCHKAQPSIGYRVILLSERELEPYNIYERAGQEFEIAESPISLERLAIATQNIYFDPKRKGSQ
jgi:uncharacterized Zn-finger protein